MAGIMAALLGGYRLGRQHSLSTHSSLQLRRPRSVTWLPFKCKGQRSVTFNITFSRG